jgi:hypothetical protein
MINKRLNQRADERESADNDYNTSTYPIVSGDVRLGEDGAFYPIEERPVRSKSYSLYYDRSSSDVRDRILTIFRTRSSVSLDEVVEEVGFSYDTVLYALDNLIQDRTLIQSSFGIEGYLRESHNVYFLQPTYGDADPLMEHYSRCVYVEAERSSDEYVEQSARDLVVATVRYANSNPADADDVFRSLYEIIREKVAILYEGATDGSIEIDPVPEERFLWRLATSVGILDYDDGTRMLFHKLYYIGEKRKAGDTAYAKGTDLKSSAELKRPSRMRVYWVGEGVWRSATDEEDGEIVAYFNGNVERAREEMRHHELYGNKFRIDDALHIFFPREEEERVALAKAKKAAERAKKSTGRGARGKGSAARGKGSAARSKGSTGRLEALEVPEDSVVDTAVDAPAIEADGRLEGKIGKDASTTNKVALVDIMWKLAQRVSDVEALEGPLYYDPDYSYVPFSAERRKDLIHELSTSYPKTAKHLGASVDSLSDDKLYFLWFFLVARKKTTNEGLVSFILHRLETLGLILDR